MTLPWLAVGDVIVAVLAMVVVAYEAFLHHRFPRTGVHGWASLVAAGAALYAGFQSIHYELANGELVQGVVKVQTVALIIMAWAMAGFAEASTGKPLPAPTRVVNALLLACVLLVVATGVIVAPEWDPRTVPLLGHAMPQPRPTAAAPLLYALLLAYTGLSVLWLSRHAPRRDERVAYGLASFAWTSSAAVDTVTTLGLAAPNAMGFLEYGFCIMAASLLAVDVRRYAKLLQTSEATQARSEENFRDLIDRVPIATVIHRRGRVAYANAAAASLLGYPSTDVLLGLPALDFIHPDDRAEATQRVHRAQTEPAVPAPLDERVRKADGTWLRMEVLAFPTLFRGESAVVVMAQDVTVRRNLTARMMHLDRMIAVGTLAAGVAHEINNPLAYVMGNLEFGTKEVLNMTRALRVEDAGRQRELLLRSLEDVNAALADAQSGAERVRHIVRDLRTLSRGQDERREPVAIIPVLESALSMAFNEVKHRARLVKDFDAVPRVMANDSRLGQVFLNLLINAAQAIPEGRAGENEVRVRTRTAPDGTAIVEISDTGQGIPEDLRTRVFDPFFTTKPVGQGTGLGLSICQGIVRECGGEVRFETEVGKGTLFTVTLPAAPAAAVAAAAMQEETDRSGRRRRVMVIDDEPLVGTAVRRLLEHQHDVVVLTSARDALVRTASGETFDAILCDLMMPDVTGMEFLSLLRAQQESLADRVVFMTGGAFTPRARDFLESVPNRWIEKPVDGAVLHAMMRDLHQPAA
jgi:PAS domain S-box-containing protein